MTNVMLLGDTHGDRGFTRNAIRWAAANDVDRIVQVGDFGFWPRTNNGQKFLHDVGKLSVELHVPFYFIDGNHEDHLYLNTLRGRYQAAGPHTGLVDGFIPFGKYPIVYIDRGTRWEWGDNCWFGAFGGAYSIDRRNRLEDHGHYGWFRDELPDESKIAQLGKLDVILTHDAPIIPPIMMGQRFKDDNTSRESQRSVYRALVTTQAKLLVHGHWHLNERYYVAGATAQGLAMNQDSLYQAGVVFRTSDRRLFSLKQWEYRDGQIEAQDNRATGGGTEVVSP